MNKCSSEAWDKLLKESKENNNIECDESFESNESIVEEKLIFIQENNKEHIKIALFKLFKKINNIF